MSAAAISRRRTQVRMMRMMKLAVGGLFTAFIGGLMGAYLTYLFTAKLNNETALQQQYLSAVQEFNSSGAKVDSAITDLADEVVDAGDLKQARKEARQAIAAHVAASQSLVIVLGQQNIDNYMSGLATLRLLVDDTSSAPAAYKASRARFELMSNRTALINEARHRIYRQA